MITGDLDRALAVPAGSAGTWRPVPAGARGAPGMYATSIPFLLARREGGAPAWIAAALARRLNRLDWVGGATVSGGGYLNVTITGDTLGALAVRITQAGRACAHSDALRGTSLAAPRATGLTAAPSWERARRSLARHVRGHLAAAAGATVRWTDDEPERLAATGPGSGTGSGPVAGAIAFAGADAVTFALCRLAPGRPVALDPRAVAAHDVRNPAYAVRYAHAHAASTLRQAASLGLDPGEAAGFGPRLLANPCERALLYELSWLPERVAGAARRGQPDVLARYLEGLGGMYLCCQESCPAVRPGGRPGGAVTAARLWLAAAARTVLGTGLGLLGVDAPGRL